ncbi:hypothetical protein T09_2963, partial [Trichinella sp. T9]
FLLISDILNGENTARFDDDDGIAPQQRIRHLEPQRIGILRISFDVINSVSSSAEKCVVLFSSCESSVFKLRNPQPEETVVEFIVDCKDVILWI